MLEEEIEAIFAGQDVDGDVDIDGVLTAFNRLNSKATKEDLPVLLAAIQSPRSNFWTRELLSEPICRLGGSEHLEVLFEAAQLGLDEGHDNDGFNSNLTEIADMEPQKCRVKLEELLAKEDFRYREAAEWLLEFCATEDEIA